MTIYLTVGLVLESRSVRIGFEGGTIGIKIRVVIPVLLETPWRRGDTRTHDQGHDTVNMR